jgi:hypothetical protein
MSFDLVQRPPRQADRHAALQAEERRAHRWQELARIFMQQPVAASATWVKASAAVLLDCRPISCRSADALAGRSSGMASTNGAPPASCSMAAATTKPLCAGWSPNAGGRSRSSHRGLAARTCSASMPDRNFMALDSPVAPASSRQQRWQQAFAQRRLGFAAGIR